MLVLLFGTISMIGLKDLKFLPLSKFVDIVAIGKFLLTNSKLLEAQTFSATAFRWPSDFDRLLLLVQQKYFC